MDSSNKGEDNGLLLWLQPRAKEAPSHRASVEESEIRCHRLKLRASIILNNM